AIVAVAIVAVAIVAVAIVAVTVVAVAIVVAVVAVVLVVARSAERHGNSQAEGQDQELAEHGVDSLRRGFVSFAAPTDAGPRAMSRISLAASGGPPVGHRWPAHGPRVPPAGHPRTSDPRHHSRSAQARIVLRAAAMDTLRFTGFPPATFTFLRA